MIDDANAALSAFAAEKRTEKRIEKKASEVVPDAPKPPTHKTRKFARKKVRNWKTMSGSTSRAELKSKLGTLKAEKLKKLGIKMPEEKHVPARSESEEEDEATRARQAMQSALAAEAQRGLASLGMSEKGAELFGLP